jgi:hypothetical protein
LSARRTRLLAFLAPFTARDGGYEIRVGSARLSAEVLSDDALEDLAARVVADFWSHRRRVRLNRPAYAAAAARAGLCLPPETLAFAAAILGAGTTLAA